MQIAIWAELLRPSTISATLHTIAVGALSSAFALTLGLGCALALATTNMRGKRLFAFLFAFSMMMAPQIVALAFKTLAGPASPLLTVIGLAPPPGTPNPMLSPGGIVLVLSLHHAPLAMLIVLGGMRAIPRHLVEAAEVDGATPLRIIGQILLPLLHRHLAAAWLLTFISAAGNFGIPALLGLPINFLTLPTLIYRRLSSFGPDVISEMAVLSMPIAAVTILAIVLASRMAGRDELTLEAGHRLTPFFRLGRWRGIVEALAGALVMLTVILPGLSLLGTALVPAIGVAFRPENLTLNFFSEILFRQAATREAIRNSFLFAGLAALLIGLAALPLALTVERSRSALVATLRFISDLPYALPGVILAIAMILLFLKPLPLIGVSLYGSGTIIVLAYLSRFLPLGLKPVAAAIRQIDPSIEEAGAIDGAGFLRRLRALLLPLVLPAICAGMLLVFLTAFNELTVSALLWGPGSRTLGVVLFGLDEAGLAGEAAALGVITMLTVVVTMLAIEQLRSFLPEASIPWAVAS